MTHTYQINGMTCNNCSRTVKDALLKIKGITGADVTLEPPRAVITMSAHIPTAIINKQLAIAGNYSVEETESMHHETGMKTSGENILPDKNILPEENRSFFAAYKPIILVFGFLTGLTALNEFTNGRFHLMSAMHLFMGGFFLVFSFFKILDLKGFAYSYMTYDIIAKKLLWWGYVYPFIELFLGLAFLFHIAIFEATVTTLLVMSISSIGVIQSLLAKRKIQCACLGTVFNLPMSNITLIEDLLMVVMAAVMLLM